MTNGNVSPLRQRMTEDMTVRGLRHPGALEHEVGNIFLTI